MKLYHNGDVWQVPGKQDKKAIKVEVPTASADLADFLNDRNAKPFPVFEAESVASDAPGLTTPEKIEAQTSEIEATWSRSECQPQGQQYDGYRSPLSASTCIAGIDAGMCASAIRQMQGKELSKVIAAGIERLAQLNGGTHA